MLACWEKCENYVLPLPEASVTVIRGAGCPDNGQQAAVLFSPKRSLDLLICAMV